MGLWAIGLRPIAHRPFFSPLYTTMSYCVVLCSLFASNLRFIYVPAYVYAERGENLLCPISILCLPPVAMLYLIL